MLGEFYQFVGFLLSLLHAIVKTFRGWVFSVGCCWLSRLKWAETTLSSASLIVKWRGIHWIQPSNVRMRMNFKRLVIVGDDQIWQIWSSRRPTKALVRGVMSTDCGLQFAAREMSVQKQIVITGLESAVRARDVHIDRLARRDHKRSLTRDVIL